MPLIDVKVGSQLVPNPVSGTKVFTDFSKPGPLLCCRSADFESSNIFLTNVLCCQNSLSSKISK